MPQTSISSHTLPEFFQEKVTGALQNQHIKVTPDAEFYIVNLLTSFHQTEKLFERDEKGELIDKALALRLADSLEVSPMQRIPLLKKMGDVALYTSGFFGEGLHQKMVGLEYYIQMGHAAYSSVSQLIFDDPHKTLRELFDELAVNFGSLVDVLSEVAESSHFISDSNLLKLYERWLATGSQRLGELLNREGIVPNVLIKSKYTQ
jgi:hypothetical protein